MSLEQLNQLLAGVLDSMGCQGLTIVTKDDDAFKPWLPDSYWVDDARRIEAINANLARRAVRMAEDEYLADTVSVESILEEGIPPLQGNDKRLIETGWGHQTMATAYGMQKRPTSSWRVQPSYDFECYQCGLPITEDGLRYKDHAGRTRCDLTLLDQETIDAEDYWTDHQPKPVRGEEEDDDEE